MEIFGEISGLSPSALKALERIYRRRVPLDTIATPELVRSLADASRECGRQVGALVHRSGVVDYVMVGSPSGIMLPEIGRLRAAKGRFRALRLVHTHLFNEPLNQDDFTDLTRLRLDMVAAVLLTPEGEPRAMTWAYNIPKPDNAARGTRGYEVVDPVPWGRPQPNFGELIEALESEFTRIEKNRPIEAKDGRAMLVHVGQKRPGAARTAQIRMKELEALASTAGVQVVESVIQLRDNIDPKYVLGKGKLESVLIKAIDLDVETLIFDQNLTPTQASTIASRTDLRVLDRTQLILDIFAQRAESKDGKLQVELAQLKYTLPRLGQKDDSLSRLTGGIGGRGPGETKLEIGRRRARERLERLEKQLKEQAKQRSERRRRRQSDDVPVIAIIGYTNAGKSTLLNALTNAGVVAENKLFATLDTRSRRLALPQGNTVIVSDTVGFIRDMPKDLFAAFRATFEEARDANLLLELVDASDEEERTHKQETEKLIVELELQDVPKLRVYNKADRIEPVLAEALGQEPSTLVVSALDHNSLRVLIDALQSRFRPPVSA